MARVLVIEDCAKTRRLLTLILAVYDHDVVAVANGGEGLCALSANDRGPAPFDLVVTEIFMPLHDGFEIIGAAVRLPQRPKILIVDRPFLPTTRVPRPDYLRMALELGADRALDNPLRVRTFEEAIATLLNENAPRASRRHAR